MKKYYQILKGSALFKGFNDEALTSVLACLEANKRSYQKNTEIFSCVSDYRIGVVLSGEVQNVKLDYEGNQNIVASFYSGDIFGEALVISETKSMFIQIVAASDCEIMFLDYGKIINVCSNACLYHLSLIKNMLALLADKNVFLNRKILHITKRTTKEKVLSYLLEQSQIAGGKTFCIPYDRQQLADYLSVERSALSATLSKLRDENIIEFYKNEFTII